MLLTDARRAARTGAAGELIPLNEQDRRLWDQGAIAEGVADARLAGHHRLDAVRAHLLERAGDHEAAIAHFTRAAGRTTSAPERDYLMTQAARLRDARK